MVRHHLRPTRARAPVAAAAIALVATLLVGCGFYSTSGSLPTHVRTVGVEFFRNSTAEAGIEDRLYRTLGDRLVGRAQVRYASARVADAIIRGTIVEVHEEPLAYTGEQAQRYQLLVTVRAEIWDRGRQRTLWKDDVVRGQGVYDPSAGLGARDRAYNDALGEVAQRIIDGLMSGW